MAKRFRRESPQTLGGPTDKSSPSSDSQDDMADTEMDETPSHQQSETPVAPAPPPKKKRTRTLTTPHQSAVLHALLAQNQRQKARRPRSESEASRKRFPQYGPFPNGHETASVGSFPLALAQGPSSRDSAPLSAPLSGGAGYPASSSYCSPEPYVGSLGSPGRLLGPGMPGSELQPEMPYRGRPPMGLRPSTTLNCSAPSPRYAQSGRNFARSPSPPRSYPVPLLHTSRPTTTSRLHDRDFSSRTLPPLVFNPMPNRSSFSAPGPHGMHRPASRSSFAPSYFDARSLSPEATFAHHPPDPSLTLPPPYTLQPRPNWDINFPALRSSRSPSWTRHGSQPTRGNITPSGYPPHDHSSRMEEVSRNEGDIPTEIVAPQRSGRYDPVRQIFIYSTPSPLPPSPEASEQRRDQEDVQDNRSPSHHS
ncbi:hypothetical protein H0H81_008922 [Sphagnurus paluster]|uniref:Uncharacterized protein n=1 Tax=Sphagnurus paluster TaxID=117069 RepID=A0A9P7FW45_9AGAR|nr:hypothetical protein H0H81_008922 [Sphagnurus paluster]